MSDKDESELRARTLEGQILCAALELSRQTGKPMRTTLDVAARNLAGQCGWRIEETVEGPRVIVNRVL